MVTVKSSDHYIQILATLLADVQTLQSEVITHCILSRTVSKLRERCASEGLGFITKTLPSLGKALDRALSGADTILTVPGSFKRIPESKLPVFLGELFSTVFDHDGKCLAEPSIVSIKHLRQICFLFYKLELPYEAYLEEQVIERFIKTEQEVALCDQRFGSIADLWDECVTAGREAPPPWEIRRRITTTYGPLPEGDLREPHKRYDADWGFRIIRGAQKLLWKLFRHFDPWDIIPRHGPGTVSTKEEMHRKYWFTRINPRIDEVYPFSTYFCASLGHACDAYPSFKDLSVCESWARVCLVPKDSRGPRLISCEPLEFMWIQQGLSNAMVSHTERHPLTRESVRFTDQSANQSAARVSSITGKYATLDLKDASDRVSVGLVRLLFPEPVRSALMACRSLATQLPSGQVLKLSKYAPMGSALCFPVMALTIWALVTTAAEDQGCQPTVFVYGDDVIVDTAFAEHAMIALESFGLKINRDKSCLSGFFRESCGMDAFKGVCVTPVRLKALWDSHNLAADTYASWVEGSNFLHANGYRQASEYIAGMVQALYGPVPSADMGLTSCPCLTCIPPNEHLFQRRSNPDGLQRLEWRVPVSQNKSISRGMSGWLMLLRYFTEAGRAGCVPLDLVDHCRSRSTDRSPLTGTDVGFRVRQYTRRNTSKLVRRWRAV